MTRDDYLRENPGFPWLSAGGTAVVEGVLRGMGVLGEGERVVEAVKAGEGNMNLTLRVRVGSGGGGDRTLIVKQSRPWVEKYDFVGAPWDRVNVEAAFYRRVAGSSAVAGRMPRFVGSESAARVLVLEDLGTASDLTGVYADGGRIEPADLRDLGRWLRGLHREFLAPKDPGVLSNREMRALNHAYIFDLPLRATEQEADSRGPGLGAVLGRMKADAEYGRRVAAAGERYLTSTGPSLLHGDFFPGSWLRTKNGVRVIDPEFGHYGPGEFDVGVCLGHLALARQPAGSAEAFLEGYGRAGLDFEMTAVTAGIEVMRRLVGLAQLPLGAGVDRAGLLERSYRAVIEGKVERLFDGGIGRQG